MTKTTRSSDIPKISIRAVAQTEQGRTHDENQDQFLVADLVKAMNIELTSLHDQDSARFGWSPGKLLLVADGMGGHAGGERASELAVRELERYVLTALPWCFHLSDAADVGEELKAAVPRCQWRLRSDAERDARLAKMGTTLTFGYVVWPRLFVVHVGDTRAYLYRGETLDQLTTDHTVAQKLVDEGVLEPEEARESRYANVLWNAIGASSDELVPEVTRTELEVEDRLLLCTDGLIKYLADDEIADVLRSGGDLETTSRKLIQIAMDRGGKDDVTVVLASFDSR